MKEYKNYILWWIVWMIQNPDKPAEVALAFRGGKGTGKGTLAKILRMILGQHAIHVSSTKMFVGDFNSHLRDCVFLFVDEAYWAGDKSSLGQLKRMITEDTLLIEGKGRDAVSVKNLLHIMMASNEDWVLPSSEDERRFAVFDVSDIHKQDQGYFNSLHEALPTEVPAFLHWALNYNLGSWHPRRNIPRTKALQEQIERSDNPERALMRECLEQGVLPFTHPDYNEPNEANVRAIAQRLKEDTGSKYTRNKALGLFLTSIPNVRKDQNGRAFLGTNEAGKPILKRSTRYFLPLLPECRMWFDKNADWDDRTEWRHEVILP